MFNLRNRTILLTGAAGHLGRAMARGILDAGGAVIMVGRRCEALERARAEMPSEHADRCYSLNADVTSEPTLVALAAWIEVRFDGLHGIVNNAYSGRVGSIETVTAADFSAATAINLSAPFLLSRGLESLLLRGAEATGTSSSIVNIASMYGKVSPDPTVYGASGANNPAHYGVSKAGMIQLTRYLACHLNPAKIRVNSVSPGPFPNLVSTDENDAFLCALRRKVPMGRLGQPEEMIGPVVFLLSRASSFINGTDIAVDGGWTAW